MKSKSPTQMRPQHELIVALDADIDRQLQAADATSAAISTRASILIAAAGLTSGLQTSSVSFTPASLAILAALIGVALLMMRTTTEIPILEAETRFWKNSPAVARRNLMHWKHDVLRERERSLVKRRRVLIAGFILLAGSISYELVSSIVTLLLEGGE
jgi:hypothetical protein